MRQNGEAMKKKLCLIIITCFIMTFCSCSNEQDISENNTTESSTKNSEYTETNGNETETSTLLPDGMAYRFEDGTCIEIDKLLAPMNALNSICAGLSSYNNFSSVYPDAVIAKLAEYNYFESPEIYADFLYTTYLQMYGENFSLSNEYISCSVMDDDSIVDMSEFYSEYFFVDIVPEYAFIVESEFCVTYVDEAGDEQQEQTPDYYIAYYFDGSMYLDYFYVDTLDL